MAKRKVRTRRIPKKKEKCYFCTEKQTPDFLEYETLFKFISERGKILNRTRTGTCSKHQRRLTAAIKRARYIALLPFVQQR